MLKPGILDSEVSTSCTTSTITDRLEDQGLETRFNRAKSVNGKSRRSVQVKLRGTDREKPRSAKERSWRVLYPTIQRPLVVKAMKAMSLPMSLPVTTYVALYLAWQLKVPQ